MGWKPSGGGDTFTLDKSEIVSSQWSRAARGHEVKILSRNTGVIQLDGFQTDVRDLFARTWLVTDSIRITIDSQKPSSCGMALTWNRKSMLCEAGTGARVTLPSKN